MGLGSGVVYCLGKEVMQASLDMGEGRYRDSFRRGMGVIGNSRFPNMLEIYAGLPRPHPSTVPLLLPQPKSRYKDTTQIMSLSLFFDFLGGRVFYLSRHARHGCYIRGGGSAPFGCFQSSIFVFCSRAAVLHRLGFLSSLIPQ